MRVCFKDRGKASRVFFFIFFIFSLEGVFLLHIYKLVCLNVCISLLMYTVRDNLFTRREKPVLHACLGVKQGFSIIGVIQIKMPIVGSGGFCDQPRPVQSLDNLFREWAFLDISQVGL